MKNNGDTVMPLPRETDKRNSQSKTKENQKKTEEKQRKRKETQGPWPGLCALAVQMYCDSFKEEPF